MGVMHLEVKSSRMHAQKRAKKNINGKRSEAQGRVQNYITYISSVFKSYFFSNFYYA